MNIQGLLEQEVFQWAASQGLDVYGENAEAPQAYPDQYAQAYFLPAETAPLTTVGVSDFTGVMQVSLYTAKGKGTAESRASSESLITHFSKALNISGVKVVLAYASPAFNDGAWYVTPVSIRYRVLS